MKKTFLLVMLVTIVFALSLVSSCKKNDEKNTLTEIVENGCIHKGYYATLEDYQIFIPNIFSPNQDGRNDYFSIILVLSDSTDYEGNLSFTITHGELGTVHTYQKIISNDDHNWGRYNLAAWDGKNSNNQVEIGIYEYVFEGKINKGSFKFTGELTLITDRTFLQHCQKCDPLVSDDPVIDCAD